MALIYMGNNQYQYVEIPGYGSNVIIQQQQIINQNVIVEQPVEPEPEPIHGVDIEIPMLCNTPPDSLECPNNAANADSWNEMYLHDVASQIFSNEGIDFAAYNNNLEWEFSGTLNKNLTLGVSSGPGAAVNQVDLEAGWNARQIADAVFDAMPPRIIASFDVTVTGEGTSAFIGLTPKADQSQGNQGGGY